MTISSAIQTKQQQVAAAYTACNNKGATLPQTQNLTNLADCIDSISGGSSPVINSLSITPSTSSQTITAPSGTDGYGPVYVAAVTSSIDQNIVAGNIKKDVTILSVTGTYEGSGGGGGSTVLDVIKANFTISSSDGTTHTINNINYSNGYFTLDTKATEIDNSNFDYCYQNDTNLREISFSSIESITENGQISNICDGCANLTTVDFSSLTTIGNSNNAIGNGFQNCTNLTTVDFSSLTTISAPSCFYQAFKSCSNLESISFPALTTVSAGSVFQSCFAYCTKLATVDFSELTNISGANIFYWAFQNCTSLTSIEFPKLSTFNSAAGFSNMFNGCSNLESICFPALTTSSFVSNSLLNNILRQSGSTKIHTIHFPSNLETTVSGQTGYPLFGGTSGYVTLAFDLTATS